MQILIPQGREKAYVISCFAGAIVNLLLNLMLIPKLHSVGAAIGTIVAEFTVMLIQLVSASNELHIKNNIKSIINFWLNGLLMFLGIMILGNVGNTRIVAIIYQIVLGALIYGVLILIQWKVFHDQNIVMILERIKRR